ncbi:MAG: ATP-binding protein [Xanthomonadaceae bacterium]|nr:ATP-binding protein [Xanthomonadaceae bacterium]
MLEDTDPLVELRFPARPDRLKLLRSLVRDAASAAGLSRADADNVVLAVNEASMNIIQHGYRNDPGGEIRLTVHTDGKALVFRLRDDAPCVDASQVRPRDLGDLRPGGLGTHFIDSIMDEATFVDCGGKGNLFEMIKFIHERGEGHVIPGG